MYNRQLNNMEDRLLLYFMNAFELIKIFGEMGFLFRTKIIHEAIDYFSLMLYDERVILILRDGEPHGVLCFSIDNDHEKYLKKGTWDYLPHEPTGKTIYIEKLAAKSWDKELRCDFEKAIIELYPHIEYGVWHRYAKWGDRKVITRRRFQNVRD